MCMSRIKLKSCVIELLHLSSNFVVKIGTINNNFERKKPVQIYVFSIPQAELGPCSYYLDQVQQSSYSIASKIIILHSGCSSMEKVDNTE